MDLVKKTGTETGASRRRRLRLASGVAFALAGLAAPATAQDAGTTTLQTITVDSGEDNAKGPDQGIVAKRSLSASKTDTSIRETPQAISVVTRDQMDAQGVNTVAEALRYTPGVHPDPNGYDIRYDWLYIRGFNTYGTMWLDGLVLPGDPSNYATPSVNAFALERIDVIKGPASVLYGRAVPGGLINQVGKRPQETAHNEVGIETSSHGGVEGTLDMTGPLTEDGEWLYRIIALGKNMGSQVDREREKQLMLAPSLTWAPSDQTSLTLYGYYQKDRPVFSPRFYPAIGTLLNNPNGQIPRDLYLGDPNAEVFERDFYTLGYEFEHEFNETWTVRQNLRYGRSDQNMFLVLVNPVFAYQPDGHTLNRASAISDDWVSSFNVDTQAEARFDTGALDHTLLIGLDYLKASSSTNFGNGLVGIPPFDLLDPTYGEVDIPVPDIQRSGLQKQQQLGLYAQDQIRYDNWVGTFGLRYDFSDIESTNRLTGTTVSNDDQRLTWRAGLTYLFDNGLAPYASYSTSFLPTLGTDQAGNPFKAQTAEQYEIGLKYEPPAGRGIITVSLFDMTLENALTPDPTNALFNLQTGEQRVRGLEIEGKYELTPELDLLAAYAYSNSEILKSNRASELGREMLRLPEHQGSVWVNYRPSAVEGLTLNAGVRAMSSYQTDSTYLPELRIPGRALVDIGAEYDFGAINKDFSGTRLRVNVTNLFDKEYVSHCLNTTGGSCNYGAGRAITASLKYSW
ncbi:TonB-dependent siderophore receptor [Shinella sp.]|uniref:TonB-dependent siderophore receptor n=1 Tax=Shinella sp. TaxID=1870904 RepID=UPI0029BC9ADF|nr:TonB-dependent siderophore receptor [Shinella sp.]MDX3974264.1 TonB-dependent siderophore receptor [Shinella sp.]